MQRLTDIIHENKIPTEVEPLDGYQNQDLVVRDFYFNSGSHNNEYAVLDAVDPNGIPHLLSTGGQHIMRVLKSIDREKQLPFVAKFVLEKGTGSNKVWRIL